MIDTMAVTRKSLNLNGLPRTVCLKAKGPTAMAAGPFCISISNYSGLREILGQERAGVRDQGSGTPSPYVLRSRELYRSSIHPTSQNRDVGHPGSQSLGGLCEPPQWMSFPLVARAFGCCLRLGHLARHLCFDCVKVEACAPLHWR